MRVDESQGQEAAATTEPGSEAVGASEESAPVEAAAAAAPELAAPIPPDEVGPRQLGPIGRVMALPEPQRTQGLEHACQTGLTVTLRSLTGHDLRVKHGDHVLVVPPSWKPFTAGHAIHILWYHANQVEEQED